MLKYFLILIARSTVASDTPRKISFGSQSEQGARTREVLMSVLRTLRKRTEDVFGTFKSCLDAMAQDEKRDPYNLLFDSS